MAKRRDTWRIEPATSGASACRHCGRVIGRGESRFGRDVAWYHLGCAPAAVPDDFAPFAKRATRRRVAPAKGEQLREPALEAQLRANPDDLEARRVYADWLTAQGDPWGEIIALALARKMSAVKRLHGSHREALTPGFSSRCFVWSRGFIEQATLTAKPEQMPELLRAFFALRTAAVVRSLSVSRTSQAIVETISRGAPPSLRAVFLGSCREIDGLACSTLRDLVVRIDGPLELPSLLAARSIPAVKHLVLAATGGRGRRKGLTGAFVDQLLASKLLAQLEYLAFCEGALLDDAAGRLVAQRRKLSHLKGMLVERSRVDDEFAKESARYWDFHNASVDDEPVY